MTAEQPPNLYAYLHTHWDREWYDAFRGYQLRLATVVDEVVQRLESGELPCFTLDGQTSLLEDLIELRSDLIDRLKPLIAQSVLDIGPWYTAPDEWLVCGESILRNLQWGMAEAKHWGHTGAFTGYLPDTFGHTVDMPQLLRHMGIETAMMWRGVNPTTSFFNWKTPTSGDSVLAYHLRQGYFQNHLHDPNVTDEKQDEALSAFLNKITETGYPTLLPIGADHLGVLTTDALARFQSQYPNTHWVHPAQFIEAFASQNNKPNLDTLSEDALDNTAAYVLPGVWSSRLWLKQGNRQCEQGLLHKLEPLLAMAQRDGIAQAQHTQHHAAWKLAWKLLLQNHAHDSIGGCSVDAVHRENRVRFDQVQQIIERITAWIGHAYTQKTGSPVLLNTLDQPYTGVIPITWRTSNDNTLPHSQTIQWSSYKQSVLAHPYWVEPLHIPQAHLTETEHTGWAWVENLAPYNVTPCYLSETFSPENPVVTQQSDSCLSLSNGLLTVEVDNATETLSITDHQTDTTHPNWLTLIAEPDHGDSYNRGPDPDGDRYVVALQSACFEEQGALLTQLRLIHHITITEGQHPLKIKTLITLKANDNHLSITHHWFHTQANIRLQASLTSARPITQVLRENHLHESTQTIDPKYAITDHIPAERFNEVMGQTFPIQRYAVANEHLLLTEGLTEGEIVAEGEVNENDLRLTLHRGFGVISSDATGTRGGHAGPPFETPEGQRLYKHLSATWHWAPSHHYSTVHSRHHWANRVLTPPTWVWHHPKTKQSNTILTKNKALPSKLPQGVLCRALKPGFTEPSTLIFRLQNSLRECIKLNIANTIASAFPHISRWYLSNGLEETVQLLDTDSITLQPGQLITLKGLRA